MKKTGLRIAQGVAVAFAIGVSAWIVVMAQQEANPTKPAEGVPASEGSVKDGEADAFLPSSKGMPLEDPTFLPSSKSSIGIRPTGGATPAPETKEEDPAFLPSSKSLRLKAPKQAEPTAPAKPKTDTATKPEAKKEPPFLPTSKSGYVPKSVRDELEKKAKEAAEAARKAKGDK